MFVCVRHCVCVCVCALIMPYNYKHDCFPFTIHLHVSVHPPPPSSPPPTSLPQLLPVPVAGVHECDCGGEHLHHAVHMHGHDVGA